MAEWHSPSGIYNGGGLVTVNNDGSISLTPAAGVGTAVTLGDLSVVTLNKVTITAPATAATLTIANNKTLTVSNTITLAGTDGTAYTFPATPAGNVTTLGNVTTGSGSIVLATAPTVTTLTVSSGGLTVTAGGITQASGQLVLPAGVVGTPSLTFAAGQGGLYGITSGVAISSGSAQIVQADSTRFLLTQAGIEFNLGGTDLRLFRDAANVWAQRNGATGQSFRLYNTFTDASNGEWLEASWAANLLTLTPKANGSGTVRNMTLGATGSTLTAANGLTITTGGLTVSAGGSVITGNSNTFTGSAVAAGAPLLTWTPGAHTAVVAEVLDLSYAAPTMTITGGYATQRFVNFSQPTISAASGLTVTTAATVNIAAAPTVASSAVITNVYALQVGGAVTIAGAAGTVYAAINIPAHTVTDNTATQITSNPSILGMSIGQITIAQSGGAVDVGNVTTLSLGIPTHGTSVTAASSRGMTIGGNYSFGANAAGASAGPLRIGTHTATLLNATQLTATPSLSEISLGTLTINQSGGSVTVNSAAALHVNSNPVAGASVTLTASYGILINASAATAGTITTAYGISVGAVSGASTNNYGIYINTPTGTGAVGLTVAGAGVSITGNSSFLAGTFASSGGIISLNVSSNFAVNIATGTTTAAVTIGNSLSGTLNLNNSITVTAPSLAAATAPAIFGIGTDVITGAVTDAYTGGLRLTPTINAATAQTVTRYNYIDVNNVVLGGAGPAALTDGALFRFNAAPGTHSALAADGAVATVFTSLGPTGSQTTIQGWVKINVNSVLRFIPFW